MTRNVSTPEASKEIDRMICANISPVPVETHPKPFTQPTASRPAATASPSLVKQATARNGPNAEPLHDIAQRLTVSKRRVSAVPINIPDNQRSALQFAASDKIVENTNPADIFQRSRAATSQIQREGLTAQQSAVVNAAVSHARYGAIPADEILSSATSIGILAGADQVLKAHVAQIKNANKEIFIQTFAWQTESQSARALLMALSDRAAERKALYGHGIEPLKVRIFVNELGGIPQRLMHRTRVSAGALPPGTKFPGTVPPPTSLSILGADFGSLVDKIDFEVRVHTHSAANSQHTKIATFDAETCIVTGMNFNRGFTGDTAMYDVGCSATGGVVNTVRNAFVDCWNNGSNPAEATTDLTRREKSSPDTSTQVQSANAVREIPVAVVTQSPNANLLSTSTNGPADQAMLTMIRHAKEYVHIFTPNMNSKEVVDAIVDATERGVQVKIILSAHFNDARENAPFAGGDNSKTLHRLAKKVFRSDLLSIRYYLPAPGERMANSHAKLMVSDETSFFGSSNQDKTSYHFSGELNLAILDAETAAHANAAIFENVFVQSVPVYPVPLPVTLLNALNINPEDLPKARYYKPSNVNIAD